MGVWGPLRTLAGKRRPAIKIVDPGDNAAVASTHLVHGTVHPSDSVVYVFALGQDNYWRLQGQVKAVNGRWSIECRFLDAKGTETLSPGQKIVAITGIKAYEGIVLADLPTGGTRSAIITVHCD